MAEGLWADWLLTKLAARRILVCKQCWDPSRVGVKVSYLSSAVEAIK